MIREELEAGEDGFTGPTQKMPADSSGAGGGVEKNTPPGGCGDLHEGRVHIEGSW